MASAATEAGDLSAAQDHEEIASRYLRVTHLEALAMSVHIEAALRNERFRIVERARGDKVSWPRIGTQMGISKQSAHQWFHAESRKTQDDLP